MAMTDAEMNVMELLTTEVIFAVAGGMDIGAIYLVVHDEVTAGAGDASRCWCR